jgi:hypothetical protein
MMQECIMFSHSVEPQARIVRVVYICSSGLTVDQYVVLHSCHFYIIGQIVLSNLVQCVGDCRCHLPHIISCGFIV